MTVPRYKVVLVGSSHAGKTSILDRYVKGVFTPNTQVTTQAAAVEKRVSLGEVNCFLDIWDTAGQERFHALMPMFYRNADGACAVFDITDYGSFERCKQWILELRQARGDACMTILIGNKADLESRRSVSTEEALNYARSCGLEYFETSAKSGMGIEIAFSGLTRKLTSRKTGAGSTTSTRAKRKGMIVVDTVEVERSRKCC